MYARLQFLLKPCMTGQGLLGSFVHFSLSILSPHHHYHLPDYTGEPRTWWVSVPVLLEPHVGSAPGRGLVPRKGGCSGNPGGHGAEQCVCFHWAQGRGWGHLEAQLVAGAAIRLSEAEHFLGELEEVHTDMASPEDTLRLRALDPRAPWSEGLSEGMKKEAPGSQAEGAGLPGRRCFCSFAGLPCPQHSFLFRENEETFCPYASFGAYIPRCHGFESNCFLSG